MNLEDLGLHAKTLIAGFSGGVVHALVFKQREPLAVIGSVLTGTLTANFLAPVVAHYVGDWLGDGGSAFVVGLTAMAICQSVMSLVTARMRNEMGAGKPSGEGRP